MYYGYYPEKREARRLELEYNVLLRILPCKCPIKLGDKTEIMVKTQDISDMGASLVSHKFVKPGTNLILKFNVLTGYSSIEDSQRVVKMTAKVVYSLPLDSMKYRIGVTFYGLKHRRESRFFDIICSNLHAREEDKKQEIPSKKPPQMAHLLSGIFNQIIEEFKFKTKLAST